MEGKLIKNNECHYNLIVKNETVGTTDMLEYESAYGNSLKFKLALNNCFNIEKGYDLTQLTLDYTKDEEKGTEKYYNTQIDFVNGFEKALEILGDKKFSEENMKYFAGFAIGYTKNGIQPDTESVLDNKLKSLQPTEWDVEIETILIQSSIEGKPIWEPKLDNEGCLILKRKV